MTLDAAFLTPSARSEPNGPTGVVLSGTGTGCATDQFEVFFRAEYPRLLRALCAVTGDRHEAEELAQDTFVRVLERWHLVTRAQNRAGYVYRMALNLHRSRLRRLARAARRVTQPPPEPDPFAATDDRDALGRALALLPCGQREALVMVDWLGMTDDEVGELLGISPITVRVRIHRARKALRPLLAGDRELEEAGTGP